MDAPAVLYALRWLIADTFRQALNSRVFWIMLALSGVSIVFCLGVSIEGGAEQDYKELFHPGTNKLVEPGAVTGHVSLLFGVFRYGFPRTAAGEVLFLYSMFASWVAGTLGILVALVWTAGFVPESLQPSAASVLLAKPVPRWLFLTGKYLGVVSFVALHVAIFFLGTWLALGVRTGIWEPQYLIGIPLMIFQFAAIFSFTVLIAVLFRSTMACVVGGVLFWLICYAINFGRHFAVVYNELHPAGPELSSLTIFLSDVGYWILPKPIDLTILLERSMNLAEVKMTLESQQPFTQVLKPEGGHFHPAMSIVTSCLFPIFALWAAAVQLAKTDY
jgi:ABC-type transport system involved in multi-copper enzyme maturation permease subunit